MKLYSTPTSPFVRKVFVAARELGLDDRIESLFLRPTPVKADPVLSATNPLSKIPALILEDGTALYDSPVICEYLQSIAPPGRTIVAASGPERFRALRVQALADGILEAGVAVFYETTTRPKELHYEPWLDGQREKARQGLTALDAEVTSWPSAVDIGQIAVGAMFGWLEFRNPLGDVRTAHPKLTAWYETFLARPSMQATLPRL